MPESLNLLQLLKPYFINIFVECQEVSLSFRVSLLIIDKLRGDSC
jgi:hypothetical protein